MVHRNVFPLGLVSVCFIILSSPSAECTDVVYIGSWGDVPHTDPHIREIAEWAVSEYNKNLQTNFTFIGVVSANQQIVLGVMYNIRILVSVGLDAADGGYDIMVLEKSLIKNRRLINFIVMMTV